MTGAEAVSLGEVPLFAGLDAEALAVVHSLGVRRRALAGGELFREGAPATTLYVILRGQARVTRAGAGGQQVALHFGRPGDVLGCAVLGGARVYPGTAELLEDGVVLAFGPSALATLVDRYPVVARNALRMLSGRVEDLRERLQELACDRVEQRIARALLKLRAERGPEEGEAPLKLSRQDLAELVGATQFTVSRTLAAWEKCGWVRAGRGWVAVTDPNALAGVVYGPR